MRYLNMIDETIQDNAAQLDKFLSSIDCRWYNSYVCDSVAAFLSPHLTEWCDHSDSHHAFQSPCPLNLQWDGGLFLLCIYPFCRE